MESIVRFVNQPEPELDDGLHWDASCEGNKKIDRATSATTMAPKPMILGVPRRYDSLLCCVAGLWGVAVCGLLGYL